MFAETIKENKALIGHLLKGKEASPVRVLIRADGIVCRSEGVVDVTFIIGNTSRVNRVAYSFDVCGSKQERYIS